MERLNRFGRMRLAYLRHCHPDRLRRLAGQGRLRDHLLSAQRDVDWELGQMIASGLDEEAAEKHVIREYILTPEGS